MASHSKRTRAAVAACWIGLFVFSMAPAGAVAVQTEPTAEEAALAGAVRERFEVDLRPDGLALTSTGADGAARMITLGDGVVAVDGVPVSGLELRRAFGDDADLVLRVTYLGDAARQALFGGDDGDAADPPEQAEATPAGEPAAAPADSAASGQPAATTSSPAQAAAAPPSRRRSEGPLAEMCSASAGLSRSSATSGFGATRR